MGIPLAIDTDAHSHAYSHTDGDALIYHERNLRYNWQQFNERCRLVAKGLLKMGIKKGDNVAIWAPNVPEWVIIQFATANASSVVMHYGAKEGILRKGDGYGPWPLVEVKRRTL